jgi:hypothetical protein
MQRATTSLDAIEDAAVLAEPVCDDHGQLLLPAGTQLTDSLVASLRKRGVQTVVVAAAPVPPEPAMDPLARQARVDARMKHLFRHALSTGHVNPLLHMVSRYRLEDPQ